MPSFNQLTLMGHCTRDAQLSYLPSNDPVCEIGLAVNRKYRKKDGEQGEEVLFVDCKGFQKTAELMNRLSKGEPVFFSGELKLDRFQDREGNNRTKYWMRVTNMQFLGGGSGQQSGEGQQQSKGDIYKPGPKRPPANTDPLPGLDSDPDDCPF